MSEPASSVGRMNIGEVHAKLREDFPNLELSKLRYFEAMDLVRPTRTPAGYRKYSANDVERLRYALMLQRDHHLPLKVIREHLDAMDRGLEPPALTTGPQVPRLALAPDGFPTAGSFHPDTSRLRLTRRELLAAAEIDDELLSELESFGLVVPRPGSAPYDNDAIVISRTVAELADYGIGPRHLRAWKTAADREVGLVEQVAAPIRRSREAGAEGRAEEAMSQIAALSVRLHATLVKVGLRGLR
ncbi:MAG TPA: MerR family transcriptional regulator [Marmoricola sp.]|nr:MerR family transcriptional regulator [Marmoricola sp.]